MYRVHSEQVSELEEAEQSSVGESLPDSFFACSEAKCKGTNIAASQRKKAAMASVKEEGSVCALWPFNQMAPFLKKQEPDGV